MSTQTSSKSKLEPKTAPRRDSLAFKLGRTFFFVGFLATVITALTAFVVSQQFLQQETKQRLASVRTLLEERVSERLNRARHHLESETESPAIADTLRQLSLGRNQLEQELSALLSDQGVALNSELAGRLRQNVARHYDQNFLTVLQENTGGIDFSNLALGEFLQPDLRTNLLLNQFLPDDAVTDEDLTALRAAFIGTSYAEAHNEFRQQFAAQRELLGEMEAYLVDADGYVIFATEKLIDFHANLSSGPQRDSPLGQAFNAAYTQALHAEEVEGESPEASSPVIISQLQPYLPAFNVPQVFLSAPIVSADGAPLGAMIYRMPFTAFNELTTFRQNHETAGLGETGEALLLATTGEPGQFTMLTDSRSIDPDNIGSLQVLNLFRDGQPLVTTASRQTVMLPDFVDTNGAVLTDTGIYTDYAGVPVVGAVAPVNVPGVNWAVVVQQATSEAFAPAGSLALAIVLVGLLALILIGLISIWSARSISRPVKNLEDAMQSAAAGNERARADVVGNDELASLAETFNRMNSERLRTQGRMNKDNDQLQGNIEELLIVAADASDGKLGVRARVTEGQLGNIASALNIMLENVANFIEQIRVASGRVASASVEIATTAGDLSQGVTDQNQQIERTTETIRSLAAGADETASATESAAEAANLTRQAAAQGAEAVQQVQETMSEIREKVQVNAQKIKRLGERSMEVSGIVKSISDISAQTDMLAFNASVESERGGEGRGFSMVADRVRDLAERTKQATVEIERLVSSIQNETAEAVLQMEKMTDEVESGSARVQAANSSLENIVESSRRSSELVEQIREIAKRESEQSQFVLQAMHRLADIAERAGDKVQQNRQTSEQLADLSSDLNAQISEFDTEPEDARPAQAPQRFAASSA